MATMQSGRCFLAIVVLFAVSLYCVPDVFCSLFLRDRGRARLCKGELLCAADGQRTSMPQRLGFRV
jgi:hypothetical protein